MKLFFIINSGDRDHAKGDLTQQMEKILSRQGHTYTLQRSKSVSHAKQLVRQACEENADFVIAGGGDGTLHVVLNALPEEGGPGISLLPMGTVNCFARSVGMSLDPVIALQQLLDGHSVPIGVGRINERRFLCFAGIGFDAAATHHCSALLKKWIRAGAFVVSGIQTFITLNGVEPFRISGDDSLQGIGHTLVLSQIRNYAGFDMFPGNRPDQDGLQTVLVRRRSRIDLLRLLACWKSCAAGQRGAPRGLNFSMAKSLVIQAEEPLHIQLDGEPITLKDSRSLSINYRPRSLPCLLPASYRTSD